MNQPANELGNEIAITKARAKRRFPGYQVDVAYPIGWPVYDVRLALTVLAQQKISAVARYILRLAGLGAAEPAEFSRLLGLPDKFVVRAAAELVNGEPELLRQRTDRKLEITDEGRKALKNGSISWSPQREYMHIPFDPFTRQVLDIDTRDLISSDETQKNGTFVIPASREKPSMGELRIDAIRKYAARFEGGKTEITEIAEFHNARLRYRQDITVIKLTPTGGGLPAFAAFCGLEYMEEETIALQRLADSGVALVPEEFAYPLVAPSDAIWMQSRNATAAEISLLSDIQKADLAVSEADLSIAEAQDTQPDVRNIGDNEELALRVSQLESERAELSRQLAERERQLAAHTNGEIRLIKTEEHRPLLLNAIDQSQSELTLVSAWITPEAFDGELCGKLRQAMERGVKVRIAWGLGTRPAWRGRPEADRNRTRGETALKGLTRNLPSNLREQLNVKRTETHEKFIICDDRFCVSGSFNWLSYRGERDHGYRRETSRYSERPDDLALWQANADSLFR